MSALTPEKLAELRRLLDTPPQHITIARDDALALLDAAAERDALAESVRAYGRTIDRWGLLIIAATHSEDITTPDGDGDWEVIESRLAEVPALLAERDALAAAWDEGHEAGCADPYARYHECDCRPNPYRTERDPR